VIFYKNFFFLKNRLFTALGLSACPRSAGPDEAAGAMSTRKDSIFKIAKGYRGRAKNCFRLAIKSVEKGLQKAYRERRLRKREARSTQILQVGAGTREHGLSYSQFIHGLFQADIGINRKMLAVLAQQEPYSFRAIVEEVHTHPTTTDPNSRPQHSTTGPPGAPRFSRVCPRAYLARHSPVAARPPLRTRRPRTPRTRLHRPSGEEVAAVGGSWQPNG
jgi:large subunit ribosomal protein L20